MVYVCGVGVCMWCVMCGVGCVCIWCVVCVVWGVCMWFMCAVGGVCDVWYVYSVATVGDLLSTRQSRLGFAVCVPSALCGLEDFTLCSHIISLSFLCDCDGLSFSQVCGHLRERFRSAAEGAVARYHFSVWGIGRLVTHPP